MDTIITNLSEGVLRIEIRRPEKKNALTAEMYVSLSNALNSADSDPEVRVVFIHGQPDAFSAGNDLEDFLCHAASGDSLPGFQLVHALNRMRKPIVASVTGICAGVGATMLLHCDLVYAGEGARFLLPFVNLGLCPEAGSSFLLPLAVGAPRAAELLMLGEPFTARMAAEAGFVCGVLPDSNVIAHGMTQARKLAGKPAAALQLTKSLLKRGWERRIADAIAEESQQFMRCLRSAEAKEALSAFLEKRPPNFR